MSESPCGTAERTILIVEDEADLRDTLAEILKDEGYCVQTAANGQDALESLKSAAQPGLILLDLMMPVMDGWEFRAEQMQDPALARIPVLVFSGDGNARQKAADLGVDNYLPKPVNLETLIEMIHRFD